MFLSLSIQPPGIYNDLCKSHYFPKEEKLNPVLGLTDTYFLAADSHNLFDRIMRVVSCKLQRVLLEFFTMPPCSPFFPLEIVAIKVCAVVGTRRGMRSRFAYLATHRDLLSGLRGFPVIRVI